MDETKVKAQTLFWYVRKRNQNTNLLRDYKLFTNEPVEQTFKGI